MYVFSAAVRKLLLTGRQKYLNLLLVGPTNCGKSSLLNPIELIYKTFANPATGKYAWLGLYECEVAYFNDFRWSSELIAWNDLVLLLEGQSVHLPRPKNEYATDMCIDRTNTIPVFAASIGAIEFLGRYNVKDQRESDMMSTRWNMFTFHYQIPGTESKAMPPRSRYFAQLMFVGAEEE